MASEDELVAARRRHADALLEAGVAPYPVFRVTESMEQQRRSFVELSNDEEQRSALPGEDVCGPSSSVWLYGRVVAKRGPFFVIRTPYGDAQALVRPEALQPEDVAQLKCADLGDHIAVQGPAMRTRTGAAAIRALRYLHVSKAILPPPAKWHGLRDVEKRYRERHVDLLSSPETQKLFRARSTVVRTLRRSIEERGFIEVETPLLQTIRGGALARPFSTHHNALSLDLYLRVAPELHLKRLLVGGFDRVYELGRVFRNEGTSTRHNPEYTLLELYRAYATYEDLMDFTEEVIREVDTVLVRDCPDYASSRPFSFSEPWARVSMRQALVDRMERAGQSGVSETAFKSLFARESVYDIDRLSNAWEKLVRSLPFEESKALSKAASYGERIFALFEMFVEPELPQLYRTRDGTQSLPVFVTEFPFEVSPLARRSDHDPMWVDRFELFVQGMELANAYTELNDPLDQAQRFRSQLESRKEGNQEAMDFDEDYVRALEHGMPPAAGIGIGVERLLMLLCGQTSIREVLLFPLLRPEEE